MKHLKDLRLDRATVKDSNSTLKALPGTFCCNKLRHGCLTCPHIDNGRTTLLIILTMQMLQQLSLPIATYLITNLQIYSLELQPSKNTARRKAREAYFIVSEAELFLLTV